MPLKLIKIEDAMILGQATRYPQMAKKHVGRLSSTKLKKVANFFVEGTMSPRDYADNKTLVDGLIEFSGGKKEVQRPKNRTGRVRLIDQSQNISTRK